MQLKVNNTYILIKTYKLYLINYEDAKTTQHVTNTTLLLKRFTT